MEENRSAKEKGYKKLKAWEKANELVLKVYKYTKTFPKNEEYGLTSQLRRAAISVPANIVEGQASMSKRDFLNFLNIANRSLAEVEYFLELSVELGYLSKEDYSSAERSRFELGSLLNGFIRSLKTRLY